MLDDFVSSFRLQAPRGSTKEGIMSNGLTFAQIVATEVGKTGKPMPLSLDPVPSPVFAPAEISRGRGRGSKPPKSHRKQDATSAAIHWMLKASMRPIGIPKAASSPKETYNPSVYTTGNWGPVTNIRPGSGRRWF